MPKFRVTPFRGLARVSLVYWPVAAAAVATFAYLDMKAGENHSRDCAARVVVDPVPSDIREQLEHACPRGLFDEGARSRYLGETTMAQREARDREAEAKLGIPHTPTDCERLDALPKPVERARTPAETAACLKDGSGYVRTILAAIAALAIPLAVVALTWAGLLCWRFARWVGAGFVARSEP